MSDDKELLPSSQTTLILILGASEYPHAPGLLPKVAFANSAKGIRDYFLDTFGVSKANLLYLFDANDSPSDLEKKIANFLKARIAESKQSKRAIRDVIIYFVGHGGFTRSRRYHLFVHHTQEPGPQSSKLEMESFANTIKENARFLRRILILDCCFAGAAVQYQATDIEVALTQTIEAFEEQDKGEGIPTKGTTLLCSSSRDDPSITLPDAIYTTFTEALLHVLNNGAVHLQGKLPLRSVARLATDYLQKSYQDQMPKPEVHSPDQSEGDIASIPFFPNPARTATEKVKDLVAQDNTFNIADVRPHESIQVKPQFQQSFIQQEQLTETRLLGLSHLRSRERNPIFLSEGMKEIAVMPDAERLRESYAVSSLSPMHSNTLNTHADNENIPHSRISRFRTLVFSGLALLLVISGIIGLAAYSNVFNRFPQTTPQGSFTVSTTAQNMETESPVEKVSRVKLGWPRIPNYSIIEMADGSTTYTLFAYAVDQSIDPGHGNPVHASGITFKLWLGQRIPTGITLMLSRQDLQNVNTIQNPLTGIVQGQPYQEIPGLNFDTGTPQIQLSNAIGRVMWKYQVSSSVAPGVYDLVIMSDWDGKYYNWTWVNIEIKK